MERKDWIVPVGGPEKTAAALLSVTTAFGLVLLKALAFVLTGSVSVLASAADSLMDIFASGLNLAAVRFADEPEDAEHRYGHGKVEGLAGLFQCLLIGGSVAFLAYESVARLRTPRAVDAPAIGMGVMCISTVVSLLLVRRLKRVARETDSLALASDSLHYFTDVLTNSVVLVSLTIYTLFDVHWLDPVASLLVCAWILRSVWGVFESSLDNLMDRQLPEEEQARIVSIVTGEVGGVRGYHDLRTRRSGARRFVDLHIEIDRDASFVTAHRIAEAVTRAIEEGLPNSRAMIHADPWPPDPE